MCFTMLLCMWRGGINMRGTSTADPLWQLQIHVFYNAFVHVEGGINMRGTITADTLWELQIHVFYNGFVHMCMC